MHVAICIVAFANPADVLACIAALARSTHGDFEVVVCENGSGAAHRRMDEALPARLAGGQLVTLIAAPGNPGYAGGVNRCLAATPDADAWWILNPDTEPEPGALAALAQRLCRGDVAAVGGVLVTGRGGKTSGAETSGAETTGGETAGGETLGGGRWRGWAARVEAIRRDTAPGADLTPAAIEPLLDYLSGASMLVGRRFLETVGPMREDYFLYCEEIEWCLRARQEGLALGFAPGARIHHAHGTTTGSGGAVRGRSRLAIYLDERNKLNVVRDLDGSRVALAALPALMLLTIRFARRGAWREWGYALAGWRAGIRGERGKPGWLEG